MTKKTSFSQTIQNWMDVFMHRSMRGWIQYVKSTGFSMPQFSTLMQLFHKGASGMSELSEAFGITPAAASQLVDKLVQNGFIAREEDPNDRRAKLLNLTDKGRELVQQGIEERYRWMDRLSGRLTEEERIQVGEALEILTRVATDLEAEPIQ
ncbi:MAG TPA: MarR family transcriptional regulator [Anaerolineales bacterium]|nr:MarR family transcriptional regulator [Anaerolineales bacterium]